MSVNVIHGFWAPEKTSNFLQSGSFRIWVESDDAPLKKGKTIHNFHYQGKAFTEFLTTKLGLKPLNQASIPAESIKLHPVLLPTRHLSPLPSPEFKQLIRSEMDESEGKITLTPWKVASYGLGDPIKEISLIHYSSLLEEEGLVPGQDFTFWYYFSQLLREIVLKDQYIPGLVQAVTGKAKSPKIYRQWQIIASSYERLIQHASQQMPLACSQGYEPESLLRHFSEVVINELLNNTIYALPATFIKKLDDSFLQRFIDGENSEKPLPIDEKTFLQWHHWRQKIAFHGDSNKGFDLGFQLVEAAEGDPDDWCLEFQALSSQDPSFKLPLQTYWSQSEIEKKQACRVLGKDFEQQLIRRLGQAAQIYSPVWMGMESERPHSVRLDRKSAFGFLKQDAWVLEDAGFKVIIPSWWTPAGRQRAKLRLRSGGKNSATPGSSPSAVGLSLNDLIDYRYELVIGEHQVSPEEWQQLVDSKSSLVHFRGQWMELDQKKMAQMLTFWEQQEDKSTSLTLPEIMLKLATEEDEFEVDPQDSLGQMLSGLNNQSQLQPIDNPAQLRGQLREYQKVGVAWLHYLDKIGLNGCLADDMGLGKTLQVICSILVDQQQVKPGGGRQPTLLLAPTSVMGNWRKEVEKFAPHLSVGIHHGSTRKLDKTGFVQHAMAQDMFITSYALIRRDNKLFASVNWHRIVLDEAQNIKNPKAAQTKAICKLSATHRLALTGTPIENRLMDLWSIFHFLNPGYLGTQSGFRKKYELPIQRDKDPGQTKILQRLLKPFMLRRLKTDKNIIQDLPDKVENPLYCNLSKEQASLYEAVVKDVAKQLEASEGIARQGLMLSTLMKLKQICNHPAQFLQDGSDFSAVRSHKLQRLSEMLDEALAEGDSILIFSQFTEIGGQLQTFLREKQVPTYYLHGGVSVRKRQTMIEEFQAPDAGPAVFILSIKAGGAGITLTNANHVFHFDRWWNPAVEDQATDRAFRIGQKKNVFVHKFITLGTLEERIAQMIEEKKKIAELVSGSDESWITKLNNEAFKQLIALDHQAIME